MIAPGNTGPNARERKEQETDRQAFVLRGWRTPVSLSRWVCDVCGMIHVGAPPLACESCGNELLTQQPDTHSEMNNHW
jgi:rubrerythrin